MCLRYYRAPPSITPSTKVNRSRTRPTTTAIAGIAITSQTTAAKNQAIAVPNRFSADLIDGLPADVLLSPELRTDAIMMAHADDGLPVLVKATREVCPNGHHSGHDHDQHNEDEFDPARHAPPCFARELVHS